YTRHQSAASYLFPGPAPASTAHQGFPDLLHQRLPRRGRFHSPPSDGLSEPCIQPLLRHSAFWRRWPTQTRSQRKSHHVIRPSRWIRLLPPAEFLCSSWVVTSVPACRNTPSKSQVCEMMFAFSIHSKGRVY